MAQPKFLNRNPDEEVVKSLITTDSSYHYIDSLVVTPNEAGIAKVYVIGYNTDSLEAVTGVKIFRYSVKNGTLSLGAVSNDLSTVTDADLGTATFDVSLVNNKIYVRIKGKLNFTFYWRSITKRQTIYKT